VHQWPPRHWIDDAEFKTLQRWSTGHEQKQRHEENAKEGTRQDAEGKKGSEKAQKGRKEAPVMQMKCREQWLSPLRAKPDAPGACPV
jgi:hypothetical protein